MGDRDDLENRGLAAGKRALEVALEQRGKGLLVLPFRMLRGQRLDPVEREDKLEIQRLLGPNVPSLSKVAIRSAGGTKSGEPCFVTRSTKATMAVLGAVSFHDGSGAWARLGAVQEIANSAMAAARTRLIHVFINEPRS
jgi:hypothetical protein